MGQTKCIIFISKLLYIISRFALIHRPVSITVPDQPVFYYGTIYRLTPISEVIRNIDFQKLIFRIPLGNQIRIILPYRWFFIAAKFFQINFCLSAFDCILYCLFHLCAIQCISFFLRHDHILAILLLQTGILGCDHIFFLKTAHIIQSFLQFFLIIGGRYCQFVCLF